MKNTAFMKFEMNKSIFELYQGDINKYDAECIVVPSNIDFTYSNIGIQGAILRTVGEKPFLKAKQIGEKIAEQQGTVQFEGMNYQGYVQPLTGIITHSGKLSQKKLIHLVSKDFLGNRTPIDIFLTVLRDGSYVDKEAIEKSTNNALSLANSKGLESIVFPALGTELYKVPIDESISHMTRTIQNHLHNKTSLKKVGIAIYNNELYQKALHVLIE